MTTLKLIIFVPIRALRTQLRYRNPQTGLSVQSALRSARKRQLSAESQNGLPLIGSIRLTWEGGKAYEAVL